MPALTDPRREAFAKAVTRRGNLTVAYSQAGYIGGRGDASKMAARPPVAARIEEIARQREKIEGAGVGSRGAAAISCSSHKSAEVIDWLPFGCSIVWA